MEGARLRGGGAIGERVVLEVGGTSHIDRGHREHQATAYPGEVLPAQAINVDPRPHEVPSQAGYRLDMRRGAETRLG